MTLGLVMKSQPGFVSVLKPSLWYITRDTKYKIYFFVYIDYSFYQNLSHTIIGCGETNDIFEDLWLAKLNGKMLSLSVTDRQNIKYTF